MKWKQEEDKFPMDYWDERWTIESGDVRVEIERHDKPNHDARRPCWKVICGALGIHNPMIMPHTAPARAAQLEALRVVQITLDDLVSSFNNINGGEE